MARFWALSLLIAFLIIIDQLTKGAVQSSLALGESLPVVDGVFSITHVQNFGAAFGMGAEGAELVRTILFVVLPFLITFWVFWALIKSLKGPAYVSLAYALILAGAFGNLLDRWTLGFVVDVLHVRFLPAFNVADACITVAVVLLIFETIMKLRTKYASHTVSRS